MPLPSCYGLNVSPPPNTYVETLISNVIFFNGPLEVVNIRVDHVGGTPMKGLVSLQRVDQARALSTL